MRCSRPTMACGLPALLALLAAGCAFGPAAPPPPPPSDPGVRAMDADRGLTDGDRGVSGSNSGTWGGAQVPNISEAPRLPLPRSRVPGL